MSIMRKSELDAVKEQMEKEKKIKEILKEVVVGNKDISLAIIAKQCNCSIEFVVETVRPIIKEWKAKILNVETSIRGFLK